MLQAHSVLRALFKKSLVCSVLAALPVLVAGYAWADDSGRKFEPAVRLLSSVQVPVTDGNTTNGMYSFDISFVDQTTGVYFLADRSNLAVQALSSESILTQIRPSTGHMPFAGFTPCVPADGHGANDCAGPNGTVGAFPYLFVTDAPSRVLTFDLRFNPPKTVGDCTTMAGDPTRADDWPMTRRTG